MQTIKPSKFNLFVKPETPNTKTKSGFILSAEAAEKPKTAEVINVGSGVTEYDQHDIVFYKEYSTTEVKVNDENYLLIAEEDVLGKLVEI